MTKTSIAMSLILVVVMVSFLGACAGPAPTPPVTPTPPPTPAPTPSPAKFKWPASLFMESYEPGTAHNVLMSALAPVLEQSTGMKVRVAPTDTHVMYSDLVAGKVDVISLAWTDWIPIQMGRYGASVLPKGQLRIMYVMIDPAYMWYTWKESKLKTIYDLKAGGFKVALCTTLASVTITIKEALPAFLGWTTQEAEKYIEFVDTGSWDAFCKSPVAGTSDLSYTSTTSAIAYEVESNPRGIRIVDLPLSDTEGWEGFAAVKPGTIPAKIAMGLPSSIGHESFALPSFFLTSVDQDEELVYQLTKWLHQNYDLFKKTNENCTRVRMDAFRYYLDSSPFPVHEGTIRYLKEIGMWTSADDKWNEEAIKLQQRYIDAWDKAAAEAKAKGITISVDNQAWLDLYDSFKQGIPPILPRIG